MPDKKLTKATIVNAFTDLVEFLNSDYTILQNVDLHGNIVDSTELFSLGLFKNGTLKTYICVKNDPVEVLYQRISTLALTVVKEVKHEEVIQIQKNTCIF